MEVEVKLFATFREAVGKKTIQRDVAEGTAILDLLRILEERYSGLQGELLNEDNSLSPSLTVLRNGENISRRDGVDMKLQDGDQIALSLPVSGGTGTLSGD